MRFPCFLISTDSWCVSSLHEQTTAEQIYIYNAGEKRVSTSHITPAQPPPNINILPSLAGKSESEKPCVYTNSIFYMCASKSVFDLHYLQWMKAEKMLKDKLQQKHRDEVEKRRQTHEHRGGKNANRWSGKLDAMQQRFIDTGVVVVLNYISIHSKYRTNCKAFSLSYRCPLQFQTTRSIKEQSF